MLLVKVLDSRKKSFEAFGNNGKKPDAINSPYYFELNNSIFIWNKIVIVGQSVMMLVILYGRMNHVKHSKLQVLRVKKCIGSCQIKSD